MDKAKVNIVWLKRDLRINNHAALFAAEQASLPYIILFMFEPNVIQHPDTSLRHLQFQYHSVIQMNKVLKKYNAKISLCYGEALDVLNNLKTDFEIEHIFSYQESGVALTYSRDKAVQQWCTTNNVAWQQFQRDGIIRGIDNRNGWDKLWYATMTQPLIKNTYTENKTIHWQSIFDLSNEFNSELLQYNPLFQPAGEDNAWKYLNGFLNERHVFYSKHISKPLLSRTSCARLSPYLAWGNISIAQVVFAAQMAKPNANKFALTNFLSRIKWHCHFIQKFEQECTYETEFVNNGYNNIVFERNEIYIKAWQQGLTGYPLVDACMRCVAATGWINFRMRAMVVSFFCHQLLQDWRLGVYHLAQQFLDYEPGIHYPQFQMQAGTTGINTVRIYNPIKQSKEQDVDAVFIKQWVPELVHVPAECIHEPWLLTSEQQQAYHCIIGKDYPEPIVDFATVTAKAKDLFWGMRKNETVKEQGKIILKRHARPSTPKTKKQIKTKVKKHAPEQLKLL